MPVPRTSKVHRLGGLAAATVLTAATLLASVALVAPAPAAAGGARSASPSRYRAISLGTLGGESSWSTAMSHRGHVVGRAEVADGTFHGFLWRRGVMTDLGSLTPIDVNDKGQVVGTRDDAAGAWLWQRGRLSRLPGPYGRVGAPVALNNRGQVVGTAEDAGGRPVVVLWSRGRARLLPLLSVSDINDRGEVSGGGLSADRATNHAVVWRGGRVIDLGAATPGSSGTVGLNDQGWVVGWVLDGPRVEGSLWRRDRRTVLEALEDGGFSQPIAVNDRGVILLLTGTDEFTARAALWHRGALTDLAGLGGPGDTSFVDLDNRSRIVGTRVVDGVSRATLWQR